MPKVPDVPLAKATLDQINPASLQELISTLVQQRLDGQGVSLLSDNNGGESSGARGAEAYAREKRKFDEDPDHSYLDAKSRVRNMLDRGDSNLTGWIGLLKELPFGTYNTKKKVTCGLLHVLDAFDKNNLPLARGLTTQLLRWMVLDLEAPKDPALSWRMTFLADPVPLVCPQKTSSLLDINSSILNPSQLTAAMGMSRDLELLNKRLRLQNNDDKDEKPAKRPPPATKPGNG
jgi:hypothetical protein